MVFESITFSPIKRVTYTSVSPLGGILRNLKFEFQAYWMYRFCHSSSRWWSLLVPILLFSTSTNTFRVFSSIVDFPSFFNRKGYGDIIFQHLLPIVTSDSLIAIKPFNEAHELKFCHQAGLLSGQELILFSLMGSPYHPFPEELGHGKCWSIFSIPETRSAGFLHWSCRGRTFVFREDFIFPPERTMNFSKDVTETESIGIVHYSLHSHRSLFPGTPSFQSIGTVTITSDGSTDSRSIHILIKGLS